MLNNWKTANEIIKDYQLQAADFSRLAGEAKKSKYRSAIITVKGYAKTYVYVNEDLWQQFLVARSEGTLNAASGLHSVKTEEG